MKVIVNGVATEYADDGTGPVILMLHGWKDSLHSFDPLIPVLTQAYRVVRLDMPGFGGTEMPPKNWVLGDYVDFVGGFISKLKLDVHTLAGHSFGGRVAIKGVADGMFTPAKLVLIASAGVAERNTLRNKSLKVLAKVGKLATLPLPKSVKNKLRNRLYKNIQSDYTNAGTLKDTFVNVISENLSGAAKEVTVPALLIWGSADTETTLEEGVRLGGLIKNSRLELIQAAGHFVHREHPDTVARLIGDFAV
ncbi:alpha/beta hydrolase [Candidatus Kaiserbacteria bacterium]|nr:alpha/beta hydrolase [Candidatus Kaiserbacteria bacterium]